MHAAWQMCSEGRYNSRKYEWLRKRFSDSLKGNKINLWRKHTLETRMKVSAALRKRGTSRASALKAWETRRLLGKDKHSPESRAKISTNHANMSGINNPRHGVKLSAKHKAIIGHAASCAMMGNKHTKGMRFKKVNGKMVRINGESDQKESQKF